MPTRCETEGSGGCLGFCTRINHVPPCLVMGAMPSEHPVCMERQGGEVRHRQALPLRNLPISEPPLAGVCPQGGLIPGRHQAVSGGESSIRHVWVVVVETKSIMIPGRPEWAWAAHCNWIADR